MIHTSHRGELFIAWDRKSSRHNWNIIVSSLDLAHVTKCAANWKDNAEWVNRRKGGWDNYQQAIALVNVSDGIIPDNLPCNTQFGPLHDTLSGVFCGIVYPERGM